MAENITNARRFGIDLRKVNVLDDDLMIDAMEKIIRRYRAGETERDTIFRFIKKMSNERRLENKILREAADLS